MISLRRAVLCVALLNLAYFVIEFSVGLSIHSVALFADSVDFLEDASVNLLIFLALTWSARARARVGKFLALLLLSPMVATVLMMFHKLTVPSMPDPFLLGITAVGALVVNVACAFLLARFRNTQGSLTKAAFYSSRNDALANLSIILLALITAYWPIFWLDTALGFIIAAINADAAKRVWQAAKREADALDNPPL